MLSGLTNLHLNLPITCLLKELVMLQAASAQAGQAAGPVEMDMATLLASFPPDVREEAWFLSYSLLMVWTFADSFGLYRFCCSRTRRRWPRCRPPCWPRRSRCVTVLCDATESCPPPFPRPQYVSPAAQHPMFLPSVPYTRVHYKPVHNLAENHTRRCCAQHTDRH